MNNFNGIGRLAADVELKHSQAGKAIAKGTIAINRDKEKADFIRIVAFGKTAEMLAEYFRKGSMLGITGSIWTGSYDKDDGTKVYTTEVCVNKISFVGGKKDNDVPKSNNREPQDDMEDD